MEGSKKDNLSEIGASLKQIRRRLDLTLAQTAARTGVSASALSKIENGQVSPSFDIIKRISNGLGVEIEELVRPGAASPVSGRKTLTRQGDASLFTSGQYDYRAHATELSRKSMVPLEMRIRARSIEEFDHWSAHSGEEFVYVLSGAIEVHTEHYAPFRLNPEESAYFDSGMKHLFLSVSKEDARVLSVSHDTGRRSDEVVRFMSPSVRMVCAKPVAPKARRAKPNPKALDKKFSDKKKVS
jgi:transcriptional regulator with XRE-family HTH domain